MVGTIEQAVAKGRGDKAPEPKKSEAEPEAEEGASEAEPAGATA